MEKTCTMISRVKRNSKNKYKIRYMGKHSKRWLEEFKIKKNCNFIEGKKEVLHPDVKNSSKDKEVILETNREFIYYKSRVARNKKSYDNIKDKKIKLLTGITAAALGTSSLVYLGTDMFFENHFYIGSKVNGMDVSMKTVDEVDDELKNQINSYTLNIVGRDGTNEVINGRDIDLDYDLEEKDEIQAFKQEQNDEMWIKSFYDDRYSRNIKLIKFDESLLKEVLKNLSSFNKENVIEPVNAGFKYEDNEFKIVSEVYGNKVNEDKLYGDIYNSILNNDDVLDLEENNCYENPVYISTCDEILQAKQKLDDYVHVVINYKFGDETEVVDGSLINTWINIDDNLNVTLDENKVHEYVSGLAEKYNTIGKTRTIKGSNGRSVKVSGGDYGWSINVDDETKELINLIQNKESQDREPIYKKTALSKGKNDIGNTYVEIDMSNQYLWFYKNGTLIASGNIVTGNVSNGTATPEGVYSLKYKNSNTVLVGDNYRTPVSFWMPFNGGIGIHDANWRSVFGGNIYRSNGSHGCVNAPYSLAKSIFYNIESGTPVICYN